MLELAFERAPSQEVLEKGIERERIVSEVYELKRVGS